MIGRLVGRVVEEEADGAFVLDVGGVGYDVVAPLGTVGRLGDRGANVTVFVHTHVREDTLSLYGFASKDDREAFRALIAVSNVGPKIAVAVLSSLSAGELAQAVERGDVARLVKLPGIGKRTAERLVLELRGKLAVPTSLDVKRIVPPSDGQATVLATTLVRMGFKAGEVDRVVAGLGPRVDELPLGDLIREALGQLSR